MSLRVEERIVAGGKGDEVVVHHLVLRGSNRAIGRHLGEVARARYGVEPVEADDPLRVRVQREWLRRNAPVLFERMRGVADALGVDLGDDAYDATHLGAPPASAGCSAVFLPARRSAPAHPLVSRAFDFAGPLASPRPGEPPSASRPYVLELHPDEGYPSLALCAFDLLGGALDGVNAEGLAVAAASDVESASALPLEPAGPSVGLDELQIVRHVLDECATAIDAREALLAAKHYYAAFPAHFLVADRHGDAFVFEVSAGRNRVHLIEAEGAPLVITNHPLHRYAGESALPRAAGPAGTYARWRALAGALAEAPAAIDEASLRAAAERAFAAPGERPFRTLWHELYDLVERSLAATFFLREEPDPRRRGATRVARSQPIQFQLAA